MAFRGLWPYLGAVQAGDTVASRTVSSSSGSSVLWAGSSNIAGGFVGLFPFLGAIQAGDLSLAQSELSVSNSGTLSWDSSGLLSAEANLSASTGFLLEGVGVSYSSQFSIVGTSVLEWTIEAGAVGAAFYINDDQTEVSATGASSVNSTFIFNTGTNVQWTRTQVPSTAEFSIAAAGLVELEALSFSSAILSVIGTSSSAFSGIEVTSSELNVQSGSSITLDSETIQPDGTFAIVASAAVEFGSLQAVFVDAELPIYASSIATFDSQEIYPPVGSFQIRPSGLLRWSSLRVVDEDDESEEDRRIIWAGAAEAERQLALFAVNDEDDLAVLTAALTEIYQQYCDVCEV